MSTRKTRPKPKKKPPEYERDPDLDKDIHQLIDEVVPDPRVWKVTPNPQFSFKRPVDLIGTPLEEFLRDTLRAAKQGSFS